MRNFIRKWLGIETICSDLDEHTKLNIKNETVVYKEIRQCEGYIGALYDYLEVVPKRSFVNDYSLLPQEPHPTKEVIKAVKAVVKKRNK